MYTLLGLAAVGLIVSSVHASEIQIVDQFVGASFDLKLPQNSGVKVDRLHKQLVNVKISEDGRTLRIYPKRVGSDTLVVQETKTGRIVAQYLININDQALRVAQLQMKEALSGVDGVSTRIVNGRVVVDGQVITVSDYNRVYSVSKMFGDKVRMLVVISPAAQVKLAEHIEREIGNPEVRVRIVNGHILLEGMANSAAEVRRAEAIAQMYASDVVIDDAVTDRKVIKRHPN